jgi:hypothetical protein
MYLPSESISKRPTKDVWVSIPIRRIGWVVGLEAFCPKLVKAVNTIRLEQASSVFIFIAVLLVKVMLVTSSSS